MEWMHAAAGNGDATKKTQPNPNAMTLATVNAAGVPTVRVVLARALDPAAGTVTFYTNYRSTKGRAIEDNTPAAPVALGFFWDHLDRQASIRGLAARTSETDSDAYFQSRPVASRIAAWASSQSEPLASRDQLLRQNEQARRRFGYTPGMNPADEARLTVPRPPWWGGFRVYAQSVQLWLGDTGRLHDRAEWSRELTPAEIHATPGFTGGPWKATRLQP